MENWIFNEDNYEVKKNRNSFLEKSIFTTLRIIDYIRKNNETYKSGYMYLTNPLLKVVFTVANLVFISLTKSWEFLFIIMSFIILMTISIPRKDRIQFVFSTLSIIIIPLIMIIPSIFINKGIECFKIMLKILEAIFLARILSVTTKKCELTNCLKKLYVPDIFIFLVDLTLKYIFILGEFSLNMLYSLKIKNISRKNNRYSSIWSLIGNLFLKSKCMADEMFFAMECKAFNGEYVIYNKVEILKRRDLLFIILNLIIFVFFLILK